MLTDAVTITSGQYQRRADIGACWGRILTSR